MRSLFLSDVSRIRATVRYARKVNGELAELPHLPFTLLRSEATSQRTLDLQYFSTLILLRFSRASSR